MRRVALTFLAALLIGAPGAAALAQTENGEAPATWEMTVDAGAAGWVAPNEPLPVRVTLSSDLLLVGRIDATVGGSTISQAIEIPAGGVKDYVLQAAAPGQRRQIRIQLVSNAGNEEVVLQSEQIQLQVPANDLVVAVIDAAPYESAIRSATPQPLDQAIRLVRLGPGDISVLNSAVSYLVVPTSAMADLAPEDIDSVLGWVKSGGRLIGAATNVSRVADPSGGGSFIQAGAVGSTVGRGEVVAVNSLDDVDVDGWSELLRSRPQPGVVRVQDEGGTASLVGAALSGRSASVPALPWLLLGILLFVVLVGPVNFIVLRSFGKPEWAWVTVPALSAIFVAGFWMVGRSQLQPFTVTHTSVVVESSGEVEGHTAFVVQVESAGDHELRMADGWNSEGQNFPGAAPGVTSTDESGRATVVYQLEDLGVGTAQGRWQESTATELDFSLQPNGNGFDVIVENRSSLNFDTWGVVVDGLGWLAGDELLAAGKGSVPARPNDGNRSRFQPVILDAVERRGFIGNDFYDTQYQQIYPMALFAEGVSQEIKENGIHFFGFTEDATYDVEVDGSSADATGATLLVVEVPETNEVLTARSSARPRLLGVEGSSSVEQYYEEIYAYGADSVFFHYVVPTDVGAARINPGFTSLSVSEVYDWSRGRYVGFKWGDELDLTTLASPTGEIVVRASRDANDQFFDESLSLSRFSMDWTHS